MRFFRCYSDSQYTTKPGIKQHPRQKFSVYPAGRTGMVISVTNFFRSILILSRRPQTRSFRRVRVKRFLQKGFTFSRLSHIRCGVCAASRREYVSNEVRYAAQSSFSRADVRYLPRSGLLTLSGGFQDAYTYISRGQVFAAGAGLGSLVTEFTDIRAIWVCCGLLLISFILMFIRDDRRHERGSV